MGFCVDHGFYTSSSCPKCNKNYDIESIDFHYENRFNIYLKIKCYACSGSGKITHTCGNCHGSGRVTRIVPIGYYAPMDFCPTCGGSGQITNTCTMCNGRGEL